MSFSPQGQDAKKDEENPLCKKYGYADKIYWAGKLFPWVDEDGKSYVRERGQYNIVQVFADGENTGIDSLGNTKNWECENESNTKGRYPENACWHKGDKKAFASLAEKGNGAGRHSEDFILNHIDELHSTDEKSEKKKSDAERDLVIMSTSSPCETCFDMESIEKMCNGISKQKKPVYIHGALTKVYAANATPRFRKCYYLYSIKFLQERTDWEKTLLDKYKGRFIPVKCNVPDSDLNPYLHIFEHIDTSTSTHDLPSDNKQQEEKSNEVRPKREKTQSGGRTKDETIAKFPKKDTDAFKAKTDKDRRKQREEDKRSTPNDNQRDEKLKRRNKNKKTNQAMVEYFDKHSGDTSMDSYGFTEYDDLLYGAEYEHGRLESIHASPTIYPNNDQYIYVTIGVLIGIFTICLAMICSYIYGVITGAIGRDLIKNQCGIKERDVDSDLDV